MRERGNTVNARERERRHRERSGQQCKRERGKTNDASEREEKLSIRVREGEERPLT